MKKLNVSYVEKEENAFALSTGDLMAGLLFIFILLLMGTLLQIQEKSDNHQEIINSYRKIKTQLYIDLQEEFKDDLKVWSATIDTTLCIRFQEPSMLFDNKGDSSGSTATATVFGLISLSFLLSPTIVPALPTPATT